MHPVTGELWAHEHGPQGGDEFNVIRAGVNYGWPVITYGVNYGLGTRIGKGRHKGRPFLRQNRSVDYRLRVDRFNATQNIRTGVSLDAWYRPDRSCINFQAQSSVSYSLMEKDFGAPFCSVLRVSKWPKIRI